MFFDTLLVSCAISACALRCTVAFERDVQRTIARMSDEDFSPELVAFGERLRYVERNIVKLCERDDAKARRPAPAEVIVADRQHADLQQTCDVHVVPAGGETTERYRLVAPDQVTTRAGAERWAMAQAARS